jgi:hypothetical protein
MDLLPVTAEYDLISERMRQMAATRYMEMIEGLRPYVSEALADPAGIHDEEPGRIQAYAALIKLQINLVKELGLLYRVQDRPREDEDTEPMVPVSELEEQLRLAQEREDAAVAAAADAAAAATRLALEQREVVDLAVARDRVARGLKALGR